MKFFTYALVGAFFASSIAMASKPAATKKTLFQSLGGKEAIVAVVDDFVANCASDPRISKRFTDTAADPARLAKFKGNLVDQICQASGGDCTYTGADMKTAHAGMGITEVEFNALVEDLQKTLNKFKVKKADQKALLSVLGPMKKDIVQPRSAEAATTDNKKTN